MAAHSILSFSLRLCVLAATQHLSAPSLRPSLLPCRALPLRELLARKAAAPAPSTIFSLAAPSALDTDLPNYYYCKCLGQRAQAAAPGNMHLLAPQLEGEEGGEDDDYQAGVLGDYLEPGEYEQGDYLTHLPTPRTSFGGYPGGGRGGLRSSMAGRRSMEGWRGAGQGVARVAGPAAGSGQSAFGRVAAAAAGGGADSVEQQVGSRRGSLRAHPVPEGELLLSPGSSQELPGRMAAGGAGLQAGLLELALAGEVA